MGKGIYFESMFLGPKAENAEEFEKLMLEVFRDHVFWRRNFHPDDPFGITEWDKAHPDYARTLAKFKEELYRLLGLLKNSSQPFPSPRYLGHMASDLLIPGLLGYIATLFYNPNNVAFEASPATTQLELEVGRQLAQLMGFDPAQAWGHITSGGTTANYEALWVARNLKDFPLAIKRYLKRQKQTADEFDAFAHQHFRQKRYVDVPDEELLIAADPLEVFDLYYQWLETLDEETTRQVQDGILQHHISQLGIGGLNLGKVLVASSMHYSWKKAVEILGLGRQALEVIAVDQHYRMDMARLKERLVSLREEGTPVLAVIGIVGSTEEGAVDAIDQIVELRTWAKQELHQHFYIHVDAAYGGYARTLFLNEASEFESYETVRQELTEQDIVKDWPSKAVFHAFRALSRVDSVTVDPHKLGYIPYPSGAVVFRDGRLKELIACFAPYVFRESGGSEEDPFIGMYILEGSKPGAAAAATYLAHKVVPLNRYGYGTFIGESIEGALQFYRAMKDFRLTYGPFRVIGQAISEPDLNIVCYAFNYARNGRWNPSVRRMNAFNQFIKDRFKFQVGRPIHSTDFILSSTELDPSIYRDAPRAFLQSLGVEFQEYQSGTEIFLLRSCILTPYLTMDYIEEDYLTRFVRQLEEVIKEYLDQLED
ncbi:MAG: tyrosine decarboxylase [Calditrichaeota bacterium]|nr:tyrosine decarboxylase [Calditrichota bacterium]